MARAKLILICQSFGEFSTNDDGTLSYAGGEAHAVDITRETLFNDLKLKLAEMWNLDYDSLSIKYFLPGNRRTLITLANDKDLKRMYDFQGNSVTADVFIQGKRGFDCEALNFPGRYIFFHFARSSCFLELQLQFFSVLLFSTYFSLKYLSLLSLPKISDQLILVKRYYCHCIRQ